jgi:lipopolysaccharide biosynthesis glycosyltransferase
MSNLRLPAVVHFVSDGKPWKVIAMEYLNISIPPSTVSELKKQEYVHVFWRIQFFKATGDVPPLQSFFGSEVDEIMRNLISQSPKENTKKKQENKQSFIEKLDILFERNKKYEEKEKSNDPLVREQPEEDERETATKQKTKRRGRQDEEEEREKPRKSTRRQAKKRVVEESKQSQRRGGKQSRQRKGRRDEL